MTHLSDYSYIDRGFAVFAYLCWSIYLLSRDERWRGLHILRRTSCCGHGRKQLGKPEFSVLLTTLLVTSMVLSVIYDCLCITVKYREGFTEINGLILQTPRKMYNPLDERIVLVADVFLNLAWSVRTSALFLLQAFWSHIVRPYTGGSQAGGDFMSSREFRTYQVASAISLILYPTMQGLFLALQRPDLSTIAPQFVSHFEGLLVAVLCAITIKRFKRLLRSLRPLRTGCVPLFKYYIRMNSLLLIAIIMDSGSLFIINVDVVTTGGQLQRHKWAFDLLTRIFNFGFSSIYMIMFFILYPLRGAGELAAGSHNNGSSTGTVLPVAATPSRSAYPKSPIIGQPSEMELNDMMIDEDSHMPVGHAEDDFSGQPVQESKSLVWSTAQRY